MREIIFDKIEIFGFLSIGEASIPLSNQGFTLVKGINNENTSTQSNGSGKSSIFEAIFWTLTGETLRGSSEVINENTKDGCLCSLTLHDELNTYEIKRSKKHKEFGSSCLFYINGDLVSDQIKKSQSLISQTIPAVADAEILGSIILLGQGLPFRFSSFSPLKRKELLETIISSSEAEELSIALKSKSVDISSQISTLALNTTKIDGQIQGLNSTLDYLNQQKDSFKSQEEITKEITDLETRRHQLQEVYKNLSTELKTIQGSIQEHQSNKGSIEEERQKYQVSLTTVNNYISSLKTGNCPTCGRPYEVTPESEQQKEALQKKKTILTDKISELNQSIKYESDEIHRLTDEYNQKLQEQYQCKSQGQETASQISTLQSTTQNRSEVLNKIDETEKEITQLKINQQEMISKSKELHNELDQVDYLLRLTSREFKSYLIKEVIDYLSSRVSYYSSYLFDNKSVTITASGNKILINLNNRPYENLSGGERQRTDLIVQFSLRDLLMVVSGFSANLIVLDEAFDNLDSSGSNQLINLIMTELSDIDSLFIITHHEELGIPYDRTVIVEKGIDGISTARTEI